MAISRDEFFDKKAKGALWDVGVSIQRGNPLPLDSNSVFKTLAEAQEYAKGVLAYPGQVLAVVEADETTIYYLDQNCALVEVGGKVAVDGKSVVISPEGVVSIKDVATAATGAILTKKADGSVEWIKPDTTTVEGLTQTVVGLNNRTQELENKVGDDTKGLIKDVNDVKTNLSTNYYNKGEIDAKVAGAFRFKGEAQKFEGGQIFVKDKPLTDMQAGDVYQVGDKEYAYDGTKWVELGFNIDLGSYATQAWVTEQDNAVKTEVKGYADTKKTEATNYTDTQIAALDIAQYAKTADVDKKVEAAKTELKGYADTKKTEAIAEAGTQADAKIAAKIGELGPEHKDVKSYVDAKDSELSGKISAVDGKVQNLGTLAKLNEVAETNLAAPLKAKIDGKADKADTLVGYGITDAMTATATTAAINAAKDEAIKAAGTQTDAKISEKVGEIGAKTVKAYVDGAVKTVDDKVGTINGTIAGYGDIVTHNAAEFEKAGEAAKVLGNAEDLSSAKTVYGALKGVEEAKAAAKTAQAKGEEALNEANAKVSSVKAADKSITVVGSATEPTVAVAISKDGGNALTLAADGLKVVVPAASEYTIVKKQSPNEGAFASYELHKDGSLVGEAINIPKDYLVKSASIKDSVGEGDASGLPVGTKYIDFVVNSVDSSGKESHIYLNVNDLVDAYIAGNGIEINGENKISAKVVAANGLSVDAAGIKLAVASETVAGAMSAEDKKKLNTVANNAQANVLEGIQINGVDQSIVSKKVNLPLATAAKVGLVKADDKTIAVNAEGALSVKSVDLMQINQKPEDVLILDCGSSSL